MTQPPPHEPLPMKAPRPLRVAQWSGCVVLVGLGVILAATNPSQDRYTEFSTQTVSRFLIKDLCGANAQSPKLFDDWLKDGCHAFMNKGETEIRSFIQHNTERQDFILFSLYTTEFPIRPLRVLGICNQFFLI
jgi:Domain of unknown function (DUF4359)